MVFAMPSDYTNFSVNPDFWCPGKRGMGDQKSSLPAHGWAVIGKIRTRLALEIAILEAAVGIEVWILGKVHHHRSIDVIVLKDIIAVGYSIHRRIAPDGSQILPGSAGDNRVSGESGILYLPAQDKGNGARIAELDGVI